MIQQLRTGNPEQQRAANSQQVINAIFSSPEIRAARAKEQALAGALKSVERKEGESETDFQLRQQVKVREQLAGIDPKIALQANDNIIKLQSQALEQTRLKQGIDEKEFELKNALETARDSKTPYIFRRNAMGDTTPVAKLDPKATPEEIDAELQRRQAQDSTHTYVVGSGLDALKLEDYSTNSTGGLNKSSLDRIEVDLVNGAVLMRNGQSFLKQMLKSPLAFTAGGDALAEGGSFFTGVARIAGDLVQSEEDAKVDQSRFNRVISKTGYLQNARQLGIESAVARGLVLNMAYTLAKSLDPGGRLSDQDVEMAIQMITGNGDPDALKVLLRERFEDAAFKAKQHRTRALSGGLNGQIGLEKWQSFEAEEEKFFDLLEEFEQLIDDGGMAVRHQSAFSRANTPRKDTGGDSTESEAPAPITFKVKRIN